MTWGGLSPLGRQVIQEMNKWGSRSTSRIPRKDRYAGRRLDEGADHRLAFSGLEACQPQPQPGRRAADGDQDQRRRRADRGVLASYVKVDPPGAWSGGCGLASGVRASGVDTRGGGLRRRAWRGAGGAPPCPVEGTAPQCPRAAAVAGAATPMPAGVAFDGSERARRFRARLATSMQVAASRSRDREGFLSITPTTR